MRLEGRRRTAAIVVLAVAAAALQVMVAASLPAISVVLLAVAAVSAIVTAIGAMTPTRRLFEYPIAVAIVAGLLVFVLGIVAALTDPVLWVPVWVQFDVLLLWVVVWVLRIKDIEHKESAWNRSFATDSHRVASAHVERTHGMGERWEALQEARRQAADPFVTDSTRDGLP